MKKLYHILFCGLLCVATFAIYAQNGTTDNNDLKKQLIGEWEEYWVGEDTDVAYNDTIKIQFATDNEIILKCINSDNYIFDEVLFDGIELSFRMENISNTNEEFYVYYRLKLSDNGKLMEGPIRNSKNQTDYVKWEKILMEQDN